MQATEPLLFNELVIALNEFEVITDDLLLAGGQESGLARRFNESFRSRGWREARVCTVALPGVPCDALLLVLFSDLPSFNAFTGSFIAWHLHPYAPSPYIPHVN